MPKSTLKVDWSKSGKQKAYKTRRFQPLGAQAVQAFASMAEATSSSQITSAWQTLGLYTPSGEVDWSVAAKTFDDWNLVLTGTATQHFWRLHGVPSHPSQGNVHSLYLCFNCSVTARWGPCEHMYALMLHQNVINECQIPKAKPKGRPPKRPFSPETPRLRALQPGPAAEPRPSQTPAPRVVSEPLTPEQIQLRKVLRAAGCGQLFPVMQQQGATLGALRSFTFTDFASIFSLDVGTAHKLMQLLAQAHWHDSLLPCVSNCVHVRRPTQMMECQA